MSAAQLIARPPIDVRYTPETLEPPASLRQRVAALWQAEKQARPSITDGVFLAVREVDDGVVVAGPCDYRLFVARERDEEIRNAVPIRPLAASGIVILGAEQSSLVLGRRSADITEYPGRWELAPSGGVGPQWVNGEGVVDVPGALYEELDQELGISRSAVRQTVCLGLVHDLGQDGYDVCYALRILDAELNRGSEYEEIVTVSGPQALAFLRGRPIVPTSEIILDLALELDLLTYPRAVDG